MTPGDDLTAAEFANLRKLAPADAVAWMKRRRRIQQTFSWQDLWQQEHGRQFTVSRLARADLLQAIRDSLTESVAGDLSRKDWMRDTEKLLERSGWWGAKAVFDPATGEVELTRFDPARLRLIFDTNMRQAAAAGQWQRIQQTKEAFPFLRYITKRDGRVRPLHASWDNVTLPVDDPFWMTHAPPNGWRCRCRITQVSQAEYDEGRTPAGGPMNKARPDVLSTTFVNRRTGEISEVPAGVDPGFGFNVGAAMDSALQTLMRGKLDALAPEIAAAARRSGVMTRAAAAHPATTAAAVAGLSDVRAAVWQPPSGGRPRIYLSGLPSQAEAVVWIEGLDRPSARGLDYVVRVRSTPVGGASTDALAQAAQDWIGAVIGEGHPTLGALLATLGEA